MKTKIIGYITKVKEDNKGLYVEGKLSKKEIKKLHNLMYSITLGYDNKKLKEVIIS